jgi:phage tail sheath protein FI
MENHGVTTLETDDAPKQTTTVNMSVIGLVGTAPLAEPGTVASLTTGSALLGNQITFTASAAGEPGNQLQVRALPGESDSSGGAETHAIFTDGLLTVFLGTDMDGSIMATAADVVAAVAALEPAEDLTITAALPDDTDGSGLMLPFTKTNLSGGENEPFPLFTPSLISGSKTQSKKLGVLGSLYADMYDILNQAGALVVVVRVPEIPLADDLQRAAIIQGIEALQLGQSTLNYNPRILIAPEWSTDDGVGKALESMADKCRAVTYLDSPSMATPEDVARRAQQYGGRVEILRPRIMVVSDITGKTHSRPYSAAAAGHRVRIDNTKGVQWSKSNQEVYGFTGLEQVDSYLINDPTCTANQLNLANVSTIIRMDGYKHWGNRLCSSDPQWRYESVRRVMDSIEDSIQLMVTKEYIDAPNSESMRTSMLGSVNSYLRDQSSAGVIAGGSAWLDSELNTDTSLAAGIVYIDIAITPYSPMEQVILRYSVNRATGQVSLAQAA